MNLWKKMIICIGFGVMTVSASEENLLQDLLQDLLQGIGSTIAEDMANQGMPNLSQLHKLAIERKFSSVSKVSDLMFDFTSGDSALVRFTVETLKGQVFRNCTCNIVSESDGTYLQECQSPEVVFKTKVFIPQAEMTQAIDADLELLKGGGMEFLTE